MVQVGLEHLDGLGVGLLLGLVADFGFDGGGQQAVEGIARHFIEEATVAAARIHRDLGHELAHQVLTIHLKLDGEDLLLLAPAQGQQAVAGDLADGFGKIEVGFKAQGGLIRLALFAHLGFQDAMVVEFETQPGPDGGVLG